jgi:mRNA-degrading endonuclease toxin of MazEF toxin-antitoxin module
MISWARKKLELEESYLKNKSEGKPYVSMGEIYYAYLGTNIGSEIEKERPVLIFQGSDRYLRQSNIVLVIPISSKCSRAPFRVYFIVGDILKNAGLSNGTVLIQQMRSISKARLTAFKGILCTEKLKEVAQAVNTILYKDIPLLLEGDAQTAGEGAAKM